MTEQIELDKSLVSEAMTISGESSEKVVVQIALREFVKANYRKKILNYKGTGIWDGNLNEMRSLR
jgi:Arc/MetJ family transcription regulator